MPGWTHTSAAMRGPAITGLRRHSQGPEQLRLWPSEADSQCSCHVRVTGLSTRVCVLGAGLPAEHPALGIFSRLCSRSPGLRRPPCDDGSGVCPGCGLLRSRTSLILSLRTHSSAQLRIVDKGERQQPADVSSVCLITVPTMACQVPDELQVPTSDLWVTLSHSRYRKDVRQ